MKKQFTKMMSVVLSLLMLCTALPLTVMAETSPHSHPICGKICECDSDSHSNLDWTAWDGTTTMTNGYYYLEKDIVLTSTMNLYNSYTTYLCLNGHSITCEDTVFDIYSNRNLIITDCMDTGKIETNCPDDSYRPDTISNNAGLIVWGGTISNPTSTTIYTFNGAGTYVFGGRIESSSTGIYMQPGSYVYVADGEIHGGYNAISGHNDNNSRALSELQINGGTFTSDSERCVDVQNGNLIINGGYIDSGLQSTDENGTVTINNGTIKGFTYLTGKKITITGGSFTDTKSSITFSGDVNISGGTFPSGTSLNKIGFYGINNFITGGNFSNSSISILTEGSNTSISGGTFKKISLGSGTSTSCKLYLSNSPKIDSVYVKNQSVVSAQNTSGTSSFTGDPVALSFDHELNSGDIIVRNVTSDAVAKRFVFNENESKYLSSERSGNNLVAYVYPHGQSGNNAKWVLKDNTLTIYGQDNLWDDDIWDSWGYNNYPWSGYTNEITKIVVESGIIDIPKNAFKLCEKVTTISLPVTIKSIGADAFKNCTAITDVYYAGTEDEWNLVEFANDNDKAILNNATIHYNYCSVNTDSKHLCSSEITTPPTHLTEGVAIFTCKCGYTFTKSLAKLEGHTYDSVVTPPTCTSQGYTKYTCACGDSYIDDYVDAYGHTYSSSITTPATHIKEGVRTFTCECGDSYTESIAKLPEHNHYATETIYPTCSTEGYTIYTCECGDTYNDDYVGYDYSVHVNEDGDGLCDYCGELATDCSCNCHSTNSFIAFFWKILNFLQRLFGTNPVCSCGMAHY